MQFSTLSRRAAEIRARYHRYEQRTTGRPWSTSELMEGFVVDVGTLMELVMAKSGRRHVDDVDRKLKHELADCLWCVLVLARAHRVDIEREFMRTMDELDEWLDVREREHARSRRRRRAPTAITSGRKRRRAEN